MRDVLLANPVGATVGLSAIMALMGAAFVVTVYMLFGGKGDEE